MIASAKPERKLEIVRELQVQGKKAGMIGDGINDAPAIATADVSFAIGTGTDVAIETADLTLVSGDISKVADVIGNFTRYQTKFVLGVGLQHHRHTRSSYG